MSSTTSLNDNSLTFTHLHSPSLSFNHLNHLIYRLSHNIVTITGLLSDLFIDRSILYINNINIHMQPVYKSQSQSPKHKHHHTL